MKKNIIVFDRNKITSLIVKHIYTDANVMFEEHLEDYRDLMECIQCYKNNNFTVIVFSRDEKEKQYALSAGADLCLTPFINLSHIKAQLQQLTEVTNTPFFAAA